MVGFTQILVACKKDLIIKKKNWVMVEFPQIMVVCKKTF
jgi:hypothetical protein